MLRTKLFKGFAVIVIMFAALSGYFGLRTIKLRLMDEAQNKVYLDLKSAWSVFNSHIERIEMIVGFLACQRIVEESSAEADWTSAGLRNRLEIQRRNHGLHFLGMVSPEGEVVFRSTPPFNVGDSKIHDPLISKALAGKQNAGIALWSHTELNLEANGLAEQAFLEIEDTPHARMAPKKYEDRGMVMLTASPVYDGNDLVAVVYGGKLLNRNHELLNHIRDVVYGDETYKNRPLGSATLFLDDIRVATTIMRMNGTLALGTRAARNVADRVLDNKESWVGEAFVVNDWHLTAYDPIVNVDGKIVGMLYVGVLRQPFLDYGRNLMLQYLVLCLVALLAALAVAFYLANRLSRPIHRLVQAASHMSEGKGRIEVPTDSACRETEALIHAFNEMSTRLTDREESLKAINRSYMETLGFVSHELKSPIASVVNYLYLLTRRKLGPLTEKQERALLVCEQNVNRIVEMIRHYLSLSRIENRELSPACTQIAVKEDVLEPLIEAMEVNIADEDVTILDRIGRDLTLRADMNMTREIFENLLSNAIKYGRKGGTITLSALERENEVEFTVHNEGEAIAPDKLKCLFEKFFRIEQADRKQRGTGLGLFITRQLVEAHGGTIRMESSGEKGTQAVFTLPKWKDKSVDPQ